MFESAPYTGKSLKLMFCDTLSIGMSKLGVFVTLKTSKVNFSETRSVTCVALISERSVRRCQGCRKMLRCPVVKVVSKMSPAGIAPFRSPGLSTGSAKQFASKAGTFGTVPLAPVTAFEAEQFEVRGTIGLVMPSEVPYDKLPTAPE